MRFGYWLPVFGGWLRNVANEGMPARWDYVRRIALRSEELGYDLTLVAELNLNDIKGVDAPSLDAWSTAAALAAVTDRLEIMVAVRPTFHPPALLAKQAASLDQISGGRLSLNVVSSWWADEAHQYGVPFDEHDRRYARTGEWLSVVTGMWSEPRFSFAGSFYQVSGAVLEPKPARRPRPTLYAGGESEAAKELIARSCDAYLMHGDPPERIAARIEDMRRRRAHRDAPPLRFGVAGYVVCRDSEAEARREVARITTLRPGAPGFENFGQWINGTQLEQRLQLEDYSVSNRGLRSGLVGTPEQIAERIAEFERAGVELLLLQFSPQYEEMERFASEVMTQLGRGAERSRARSEAHTERADEVVVVRARVEEVGRAFDRASDKPQERSALDVARVVDQARSLGHETAGEPVGRRHPQLRPVVEEAVARLAEIDDVLALGVELERPEAERELERGDHAVRPPGHAAEHGRQGQRQAAVRFERPADET